MSADLASPGRNLMFSRSSEDTCTVIVYPLSLLLIVLSVSVYDTLAVLSSCMVKDVDIKVLVLTTSLNVMFIKPVSMSKVKDNNSGRVVS